MSKLLKFNEKALRAMHIGVKKLAKAVIVTLGPRGRNVVIKKGFGPPQSTKDGVTVAKEITLKDKFENMGAQLVKEASSKTSDKAGDGTTTAIVLASALFEEGVKHVVAGHNPMELKKGVEKGVAALLKNLDAMAIQISSQDEIKQIATISANNDPEIGKIISDAMEKVGRDGTITTGDAKGLETTLKVTEGMLFDKGYLSPYFITNPEKMSVEFDGCDVVILDRKLSSAKEIVPLLEQKQARGDRPLLIIAEDVENEALATLVVNKVKGGMNVCAVKAPAFGDRRKQMLEDIAVLCGATVISREVGLDIDNIEPSHFGAAKKVTITKEETTLVDGAGSKSQIEARASQIRAEINSATSDYDREKLTERLAKLSGGVAVIEVGAGTEAEQSEKKDRVEDALHATRAATLEGIVPGGGVALIRAAKALESLELSGDEELGRQILMKVCFSPAIAIAENCGEQGNLVAEKIANGSGNFGYNGLTGEFEDLVKAGVIDPVLVTKSALKHAASISSLLLTVSAMVTDKPEPKKESGAGAGGGMPGMGGPMGGMGGMPPGMGMM